MRSGKAWDAPTSPARHVTVTAKAPTSAKAPGRSQATVGPPAHPAAPGLRFHNPGCQVTQAGRWDLQQQGVGERGGGCGDAHQGLPVRTVRPLPSHRTAVSTVTRGPSRSPGGLTSPFHMCTSHSLPPPHSPSFDAELSRARHLGPSREGAPPQAGRARTRARRRQDGREAPRIFLLMGHF